jgi:hypothetical protein
MGRAGREMGLEPEMEWVPAEIVIHILWGFSVLINHAVSIE